MSVVSIYTRPEHFGRSVFPPSKAETAGYIPPKVQIENMILAGKRLEQARKEAYDFGPDDEVDYGFHDPTRDTGFDLADASRLAATVSENMKSTAQKRKEAIAEEKAKALKDTGTVKDSEAPSDE